MKPLSLHLENVRTFQSIDFDFPEGACAITGPNGAGKSTLISALDVALFGAEGRSLSDWLSRDRPEQTMVIELLLEHGGDLYRVRRSFHAKKGPTCDLDVHRDISLEWESLRRENVKATEAEIQRITGLTRATFWASAYAPQGRADYFCRADPKDRKTILAKILGLEVWDGYQARAKADLAEAKTSLAVVRAKIEQAETDLAERPGLQQQKDAADGRETAARDALAECTSQLAKARERLSKLREQSGLREAAERARDAAEASHASLLARSRDLEREIQEIDWRLTEREALQALAEGMPALEAERQEIAEKLRWVEERSRLEREAKASADRAQTGRDQAMLLTEQARTAERGELERCDHCGQTLAGSAGNVLAVNLRERARRLVDEADVAEEHSRRLYEDAGPAVDPPDQTRAGNVEDQIVRARDAQQKLAALTEVEARRDTAQDELQKVRAELPERDQAVTAARAHLLGLGPYDPTELQTAQRLVATHEAGEREAQKHVTEATAQIARLDERLARIDKTAAELEIYSKSRDDLQNEVELLSHLERACGPNGVPALILETSAIPQMEAEWNRVLRLLPTESGDIFEVELHTQREKKDGDGAVDALDVVVYANGTARPYATYSGGERMRIDVAQRRALSNLLAHRKGAECPLMILDEPNSLDDQGMGALAQVLEDLAASEGLTILTVSHDPALRDAFAESIQIEKVDGRSRIVTSDETTPVPA